MESLAPVLADRMITLLDLLPAGTPVVNVGPERIEARAVDLARTSEEFLQAGWHNAAVGNAVPLDLSQAAYRSTEQLRAQAHERQLPVSGLGTLGAVAAGLKPAPAYRGDVGALPPTPRGGRGWDTGGDRYGERRVRRNAWLNNWPRRTLPCVCSQILHSTRSCTSSRHA